jgi:diacylglycerol kinase (ATP)
VCVIVNPAAGRGRGARLLAAIRRAFGAVGVTEVRTTVTAGEERVIARRAIDEGYRTLVAVGGDGTWSNVGNAILTAEADSRLALIAAGTGNDFAKTVGAPARDIARTAQLAVEGPDVRLDVGRIEGKHFLNVAGFGFDIAVLEDVARVAWLRGDALYFYSALRQLMRYEGLQIDVSSPRGRRGSAKHLMLIVANACTFGGAFRIAPQASLTDGLLDGVSIRDAPPLRRVRLFSAAARGTHTAHPEVATEQAPCFTLRFAAPPAYETDGEYHQASTAELEVMCVPRALRVVRPAEAARV